VPNDLRGEDMSGGGKKIQNANSSVPSFQSAPSYIKNMAQQTLIDFDETKVFVQIASSEATLAENLAMMRTNLKSKYVNLARFTKAWKKIANNIIQQMPAKKEIAKAWMLCKQGKDNKFNKFTATRKADYTAVKNLYSQIAREKNMTWDDYLYNLNRNEIIHFCSRLKTKHFDPIFKSVSQCPYITASNIITVIYFSCVDFIF
jgi:hypothetical protein